MSAEAGRQGLLPVLNLAVPGKSDEVSGSRFRRLTSHAGQGVAIDTGPADVDQGDVGLEGPELVERARQ